MKNLTHRAIFFSRLPKVSKYSTGGVESLISTSVAALLLLFVVLGGKELRLKESESVERGREKRAGAARAPLVEHAQFTDSFAFAASALCGQACSVASKVNSMPRELE